MRKRSAEQDWYIAYHEAGHLLAAYFLRIPFLHRLSVSINNQDGDSGVGSCTRKCSDPVNWNKSFRMRSG
jgi:hypothetical protein